MRRVAQSFDAKGSIQDRVNKYKTYINTALKRFAYFKQVSEYTGFVDTMIGIISTETHFRPEYFTWWTEPYIYNSVTQVKKKKDGTWGIVASTGNRYWKKFNITRQELATSLLDPLNTSRPQKYLVAEIITPHGLGQVMGYHFLQDTADFCPGFRDVTRVEGDYFICSQSSPAGTINNMFSGINGEENQVRAAMTIFAWKYNGFISKKGRSMIEAAKLATKGYLGGAGGDANGTTPEVYLARVEAGGKPPFSGASTGSYQMAANKNATTADISKACDTKVA